MLMFLIYSYWHTCLVLRIHAVLISPFYVLNFFIKKKKKQIRKAETLTELKIVASSYIVQIQHSNSAGGRGLVKI